MDASKGSYKDFCPVDRRSRELPRLFGEGTKHLYIISVFLPQCWVQVRDFELTVLEVQGCKMFVDCCRTPFTFQDLSLGTGEELFHAPGFLKQRIGSD